MGVKRQKLVTILLTSFAMFGCSSTTPKKSYSPFSKKDQHITKKHVDKTINSLPKATPPSWIDDIPNNDDFFIYGVGAGVSFDRSIENALADMAQRLQVSVSANTSLQTISHNENISQELIQQVSTTTEQINIPNYKIINQSNSNNTFYVEIQVNIKDTIKTLNQKIFSSIQESEILLNTAENKNSLARFNLTKKIDSNITKIKSSLRTLLILDPDVNIADYMRYLNDIDNQNLNLKRNINIYISENASSYFYVALRKYINVRNFNITNKLTSNLKLSLRLVDYNNSSDEGSYCINTKIELQIQDSLSNQLHIRMYNIKTCSTKGRDAAIEKASEKFYSELNKNMVS